MNKQDLDKLKSTTLQISELTSKDLPAEMSYKEALGIVDKQTKLINDCETKVFNEEMQTKRFEADQKLKEKEFDLNKEKHVHASKIDESKIKLEEEKLKLEKENQKFNQDKQKTSNKIDESKLKLEKERLEIEKNDSKFNQTKQKDSMKIEEEKIKLEKENQKLDKEKFESEKNLNDRKISIEENKLNQERIRIENDKARQELLIKLEETKLDNERSRIKIEELILKNNIEAQKSERKFRWISLAVTTGVGLITTIVPIIVYKKLAYLNLALIYRDEGRPTQDFKDAVKSIYNMIKHK